MTRSSRLLVGASLAALAVGCAHTSAAANAEEKTATQKVVVTGSHIPRTVDMSTGFPPTFSPMRVYSREQLSGTGRSFDMRAALRTLDPSIGP
jgi:hypothetical protein